MERRLTRKQQIWFWSSLVLLALPVFLPSTADFDLIGVCSFILIVASYPLNLLFVPFYYLLDYYLPVERTPIGQLYFFMVACSFIGYLQWFVVFPFLLGWFRGKFIYPRFQTLFGVNSYIPPRLHEAKRNVWQTWFDEKERSHFERVINKDGKD